MGGGAEGLTERILCLTPGPEPTAIFERIKARHPNIEFTYVNYPLGAHPDNRPTLDKDIFLDKTIVVSLSALPQSREDCPNLKLVHLSSAGGDRAIKHPLFLNSDIKFTTSSGIHGPQIAEWVIMTALVRNHFYNTLYEAQRKGKWDRTGAWGVRDYVGQRLAILGYGSIGRQVARVGNALGMNVIAYTASPRETPEERADSGFIVPGTGDPDGSIPSAWYSGLDKESLHNFLKQDIDMLVVCVPLTPKTRHFIGSAEFDILGRHPCFISNIARGSIIDQPAMVAALHDGRLSGAALDVTDPEPLPEGDPLWAAPNTIITPHISGITTDYTDRSFQVLEKNLERLEKGEPLINVLDREKGY